MLSIDTLPVSRERIDHRLSRLRDLMGESDVDLCVFTSPENIYYLTGIDIGGRTRPHALVVRRDGAHAYITRVLEKLWHPHWARLSWAADWHFYSDDSSLPAEIAVVAKRLGHGPTTKIGLEHDRPTISYADVRSIMAAVGTETLHASSQLIERLRMIKDPEEVDLMRKAGEITRAGIEAAAEIIRNGGTEAEAAGEAFARMARHWGSQALAGGPFVASGKRSAMAHGNWEQVRPEKGDLITIWMSASYFRYQSPVERTYSVGEPSKEIQHIFDTVVDAAEQTMAKLKPGLTAHEGDRICRDVIEERGYGKYFLNRVAYGIGISYPPVWAENYLARLRPDDELVLEPGMTMHLVPALHIENVGLVHRSVPIVITESGCEPLSSMPLRLDPL